MPLDYELSKNKSAGPSQNAPVKVTVGPVADAASSSVYDQTENDAPYTVYHVRKRYVNDPHIIQLPIASSKANVGAAICQLAAPTSKLVVEWTAERSGAKPKIPSAAPRDGNVVLAGEVFEPAEVVPESDGTSIRCAIRGVYTYFFKSTNKVVINAGLPPWVADGPAAPFRKYQPPGDSEKGVIGTEA